jgi:hypothetical protein
MSCEMPVVKPALEGEYDDDVRAAAEFAARAIE